MAFNKGKSNKNRKGGFSKGGGSNKKKANYAKLGALMESKEYKSTFFAPDSYNGTLLFVSKGTKADSQPRIYKVGACSFTDREALEDRGLENLPQTLVGNISMNLDKAEEVDLEKIDSLEDLFEDEDSDDEDEE